MSADRERLIATLNELREQLGGVDELDPDVRQRLEQTLHDVEGLLEKNPPRKVAQPSIAERLSDAARHFEESHPTLSGTLGSVIDTLGRMGI